MPLSENGLALEHLEEASARAGISLTPYKGDLGVLDSSSCPMLVVNGKTGHSVVVEKISNAGKRSAICHVLDSQGDRENMRANNLLKHRAANCFIARPTKTTDERVEEIPIAKQAHWFWSALAINRGIYGHIIIATLVVNLLALSGPLVTMNIYDRVVANAAFTTLWSLAAGAGIAAVFDLFCARFAR